MTLLVGLDVGTTSVKACVYRPDGTAVAGSAVPTPTHHPRPGWAHHEPDELWGGAVAALRGALGQLAPGQAAEIAGVAVASMGEAGVPLDERGRPTHAVIAWYDTRSQPQADVLAARFGHDALFATTGLSLQPIWSLLKLLWLKDQEPEAFARTRRWLNVADYIAFRLCGVAATDPSLASRTHALDLRARRWDEGLLGEVGIRSGTFAPLVQSGTALDTVTPAAAAATGLPLGARVAAGGHDHVCGALAVGVTEPGEMLNSLGTAEAIFLPLEAPLADPVMGAQGYTQGAHVVPDRSYVFGGQYTTGAAVDWLRDVVGRERPYGDLIAEAEAMPPGSLGVGFLPYLRIAAPPHNDPRARAAFVGLTADTPRGAMVRAVFEGLAFESRASLEPLFAHTGLDRLARIVAIGGGTRNRLLMRIKATVQQQPSTVANVAEATTLGAAMLAGLGAGVYRDVPDALGALRYETVEVPPVEAWVPLYDAIYDRAYRRIYPALRDLHHALGDLQDDLAAGALAVGNGPPPDAAVEPAANRGVTVGRPA